MTPPEQRDVCHKRSRRLVGELEGSLRHQRAGVSKSSETGGSGRGEVRRLSVYLSLTFYPTWSPSQRHSRYQKAVFKT
jgi:hypothetical protein